MVNLTFGEQVKIILSRKGMTIKQLAELVEAYTGKPMSRQNMTQRLGRDNFQEQDMRLIAEILGCKFELSIMEAEELPAETEAEDSSARDITVGELVDIPEEVEEAVAETAVEEVPAVQESPDTKEDSEERKLLKKGIRGYFKKSENKGNNKEEKIVEKPVKQGEGALGVGEINPYTGKEYKTNSVRMHPKRIGYVQVYDQEQHKWTDMTEWAFLGYQERKKVLLGKDYQPPIYLD